MDDFFHYSDFLPFLFRTHTIISSSDLYTTFSFNHPQSLCSLSTSCQQFIFSKEFRSSQVSSCQGPAIYKQVLPLAGAKASITTQLPTVPSQRAISFSTKSQPGKHLRVLTRSKVKKPCATMVPGTKEATELGKIDGGWRYYFGDKIQVVWMFACCGSRGTKLSLDIYPCTVTLPWPGLYRKHTVRIITLAHIWASGARGRWAFAVQLWRPAPWLLGAPPALPGQPALLHGAHRAGL